MPDLNDDILERLLREHFAAEVDGQLGRAPAAIARSRRRLPWRAVLLPLTAAAAAVVLLLPTITNRTTPAPTRRTQPVAPTADASPVDHVVEWRDIDQGTIYVNDGIPMRGIRRQRLDSFTWTDPNSRETTQMTIPHDEIVLIGLPAN